MTPMAAGLSSIGVLEFLEHDPRPTFILDLQNPTDPETNCLRILQLNPSLQYRSDLSSVASGRLDLSSKGEAVEFKQWIQGCAVPTFCYIGYLWTTFTLRKRWRIISANSLEVGQLASLSGVPSNSAGTVSAWPKKHTSAPESSEVQSQWTDLLPNSQHVQFFKNTDWSATPLGPLETWSNPLRQMTRFLMADSRAACLFW